MVQNLRVDIIYHMSPSDFEMEFNLSGCCRMRLLSDKTTDKKGFVKALARDVSRSRVIIACGPLFGVDGLISIVATAIGNGTAVCNNKTYGINSDDTIHIIDGSTPLVTSDGYFCGCIIESGPQTIILLTENKTFRKSVMQSLIHPYIEEISYIPSASSTQPIAPKAQEEFETAINEEENYIAQIDKEYETPAHEEVEAQITTDSTEDEHNIEFIMDNGADAESNTATEGVLEVESNYFDLYTEVETPEEIKARYDEPYTPSESDNMFLAETIIDDEEIATEKPHGADGQKTMLSLDITIVILILLLSLAVLALIFLVVIKPMSMGIGVMEYLKDIFAAQVNLLWL